MTIHRIPAIIIVSLMVIYGCATAPPDTAEKKEADATPLLEEIVKLNAILPRTVSASFRIESKAKNSFRTSAKLVYDVEKQKARMSIVDSVFGTQLSVVVRDADTLYIHQPIEKTVMIFHYNRFPVHSFLPFEMDIELIDNLLIGKIPILKNYKQARAVEKGNGRQFILLENDDMHQTISIADRVPDKMLFVNKRNNARYEIYFIKPSIRNNIFMYKGIRLVDVTGKSTFELTVLEHHINRDVQEDSVSFRLPKNTVINDYR